MPRSKRKESESGIYHVMLRGINQQQIFEDSEDYEKFLQVLINCQLISGFVCYAYCLMGNHVHLLLRIGTEPLGQIFKRLGTRYVYWYNWKYSRSGHLFQDRYKSELVEDDAYLLSVARYIHQNPVKAGLVANAADYPWSSAAAFLAGDGNGLVHGEELLRLFAGDAEEQRQAYQDFLTKDDGIVHLEDGTTRVNDAQVRTMMLQLCGTDTVAGFQGLPINVRDGAVAQLHKKGASLRQLARLTGLTLGIIRKLV